jgi:hypothetical protein
MAVVKVYHDRLGNTLTVWFGNPADEVSAEETGDEVILMKNAQGEVIGFEKLNFAAESGGPLQVALETLPIPGS